MQNEVHKYARDVLIYYKKPTLAKLKSTINKMYKDIKRTDKEVANLFLKESETYVSEFKHYEKQLRKWQKRDLRKYKSKVAKYKNKLNRSMIENKLWSIFETLGTPRTQTGIVINMYEEFGAYEIAYGREPWELNVGSLKRMWDRYVMYYFSGNERAAIDNYNYFKELSKQRKRS